MTTPDGAPDLSPRAHRLTVERTMRADPDALFRAWPTILAHLDDRTAPPD